MNNDPILAAVIEDLRNIRHNWTENNYEYAPDTVKEYIAKNHDALQFFVEALFKSSTINDRKGLCEKHRDLDGSVLVMRNANDLDALGAVEKAVQPHEVYVLSPIVEDDIVALIRPIEYVRYLDDCAHYQGQLYLSPFNFSL